MNMGGASQLALKWLKVSLLAALGGGIAAAFTASMDPLKYSFPHDFGSGKLWKFFFMGVAVTFGALLVKSPLGQKAMSAYKETHEKMAENKPVLEEAKADLKTPAPDPDPAGGPPGGPPK
jgi:hypothetical protein